MSNNTVDIIIGVIGGSQGLATAGGDISLISAGGQAIAGVVSIIPGASVAINPAAGLLTFIKIGIDANKSNQVNIGDAISIVGNSVSVVGAILTIVPGGQPVGVPLLAVGRALALALAGIAASFLDINYPLAPRNGAVGSTTNTCFRDARNWTQPRDPLVLDLDGDGIEAVGINTAAPILFDHDGDGTRTGTGWIAGDDGIVVLDRNGNGLIDNGGELFGDNTVLQNGPRAGQKAANGYEALADMDANGDGQLNSSDAAYTQLRIWKDANQDGVSQAGELFTLGALGIASINVNGTASNTNLGNGNTQPWSGSFTRADGSVGASGVVEMSGSLLLAGNNFYREFTDHIALTEQAKALHPCHQHRHSDRRCSQRRKRGSIFPVTLDLSQHTIDVDVKNIWLSPGMNLTAEIKTGKRRIIEYLLSPVQRAAGEILMER